MTALAFGVKCGFLGASGSFRGGRGTSAPCVSFAINELNASAPTPTPQSRKKCRRVQASVEALSISREVILLPCNEFIQIHQHSRDCRPCGFRIGFLFRIQIALEPSHFSCRWIARETDPECISDLPHIIRVTLLLDPLPKSIGQLDEDRVVSEV